MGEEKIYDITIIGAGPVGLFTTFYAGMREASVNLIDSMPQVGGQLSALYPEKYIYDVAGFEGLKAQKLVDHLHKQALTFSPTITLDQSVEKVVRREDGIFELTTPKETHYTRCIIITAGAGAFQPRKLKIELADQYEDHTLHYFVKNLDAFKDRNVLVCGGGDSAVDWALELEPIAKTVTLIHRRGKFRAHEHSVTQLENSTVAVKTPYEVDQLIGNGKQVERVLLQEVRGDATQIMDVDDVIVNYGFVSSLGPLKTWGLDIQKNAITVNRRMETNIPGIFAAGDVCSYEGRPKLIATGFGEGPIAVNHAKLMMDPKAKIHTHSTHLFAATK